MATVTFRSGAFPGAGKVHAYTVTGLVNGSQTLTCPAPPLAGSFDPSGNETPTFAYFFSYAASAIGPKVTADPASISNSSGTITLTANSDGSGSAIMWLW